jgi:hypothetical protein
MIRHSLIVLPLAVLAACKPAPDATKADAESAPAADQVKVQAGEWETTTELVTMELEGVDPALLKDNIGKKTTIKNCVTPEQAARPAAEFFANPEVKDGRCKSEKFEMAGGRMNGVVTCEGGEGETGPMRMEMTGTYAPDAYATTVTMTGSGAGGKTMKMVARSSGKHVADACTG